MPIVTWRDEYNINVEQLDSQHQKMLEIVNNLHAAVEARENKSVLRDMLVELAEFTRVHFSTEEDLMKKYSFPDFQDHQIQHRLLLQHLNDLATAVSIGKHPTFYSDYDVSTDWALVHISEYDKSLGLFLNSKGIF